MLLFSITWGAVSGWWAPVCLLLGLAYAWLMYRHPVNLAEKFRKGLFAIRALAVFIIALLLLSPFLQSLSYQPQKPLILVAQDNSQSVSQFKQANFNPATFVTELGKLKELLGDDYDVREFNFGGDLKNGLVNTFNARKTDMSAALRQLNDQYANQNIGAVIMATDGMYNQGADPQYEASGVVPMGGVSVSNCPGEKITVGRDKRQVHHPPGRAERARRTQDRHSPRPDLCRRAASPLPSWSARAGSHHVLDQPSGYRAIAAQDRCPDTSAGGFILLNDYVDVIRDAARRSRDRRRVSSPKRSLQGIEVLAIDQAIPGRRGRQEGQGRRHPPRWNSSRSQAEIILVAQQMAQQADRCAPALSRIRCLRPNQRARLSSFRADGKRREPCASSNPAKFPEVGARK